MTAEDADARPGRSTARTEEPDETSGRRRSARAVTRAAFGTPGPAAEPAQPVPASASSAGSGVLLAYAIVSGLRNAASILVLIFVALFLAIGLNPAVNRLRSWGLPRGAAVAIVSADRAGAAGRRHRRAGPAAGHPDRRADQQHARTTSRTCSATRPSTTWSSTTTSSTRCRARSTRARSATPSAAWSAAAELLFGTLFNVLTVLVLTIYFMAAFDRIKSGAYRLVPAPPASRVQLLTDEILTKVGAYMVGALAIAVLAGASTFILAMIIGLAYPFALAVVVAVCDLIPQIGATLGAVVVSLVGLASSLTARHRLRRLLHRLPAGGELPDLPERDAPLGQGQRRGRGGRRAARAWRCSASSARWSRSRWWPRSS